MPGLERTSHTGRAVCMYVPLSPPSFIVREVRAGDRSCDVHRYMRVKGWAESGTLVSSSQAVFFIAHDNDEGEYVSHISKSLALVG